MIKEGDKFKVPTRKAKPIYGIRNRERYSGYNWVVTKKTNFFCIYCGTKGLRVEVEDGDYYVGPDFFCDSCYSVYTMG